MADLGKVEKMLVLAFQTSEDAERGGRTEAAEAFEALVNPETYTLEYKVRTNDTQGAGTSGAQLTFQYTEPEELSFDFLFDNTGLIDGRPKPEGIFDDVEAFRRLLMEYRGNTHEPYHLKLIWGKLVFTGRAMDIGITYKLFNPDGQPIRAVVKVKFKRSVEEKKRAATEDRRSPDLTHRRTVRPGDTLPLMCFQVYGDPRHYLFVAEQNRLDDFRRLEVGATLRFPPLPAEVAR